MFLRCRSAPSTRVTETQLGGDHLADGGMRGSRFGGIAAGVELQLGCVHDLNFWDLDGDDDPAGGNRRPLGETNDRVVLTSAVISIRLNRKGECAKLTHLMPCHQPLANLLGTLLECPQQVIPTHTRVREHLHLPHQTDHFHV